MLLLHCVAVPFLPWMTQLRGDERFYNGRPPEWRVEKCGLIPLFIFIFIFSGYLTEIMNNWVASKFNFIFQNERFEHQHSILSMNYTVALSSFTSQCGEWFWFITTFLKGNATLEPETKAKWKPHLSETQPWHSLWSLTTGSIYRAIFKNKLI